jgi:polysaccharide export outer membrane protein
MLTDAIRLLTRFAVFWLIASFMLTSTPARANGDVDYRLGPGDLIRVSVFGSPELSNEVRVSDSGYITYPLVGSIEVAGRSTAQVEAMLKARFIEGGYLRDPQVLVHVAEYQSQKVSVLGHVMKPGQYTLQSSSRVLDMLAAAGGLRTDEAGDSATLIRKDGSRQPIDLHALFDGDPTYNVNVRGGDTLYVPRAPQFYIYGEVNRPGVYKLERGMTVSRAISAGGGLTSRGSERRVVVKRKTSTGEEKHITLRGHDLLQPDDVLMVKEGLF